MSAKLVFGDSTNLGIFSAQADIGNVAQPGSVNFDPANGEYLIAGSGGNMWFTNDAFHFVWKEMSGDLSLAADIRFLGTNGNPHRKACLVIRQSLDPDSAYVDVALHGVGLTSLQYRETAGGTTHEIQSNISMPARVGIEKHGDYFHDVRRSRRVKNCVQRARCIRFISRNRFTSASAFVRTTTRPWNRPFFQTSNSKPISSGESDEAFVESALEVVGLALMDRRVIYQTRDHIEAPNWSRDGKYFLFNSDGRIYKLPVEGGTPELLEYRQPDPCATMTTAFRPTENNWPSATKPWTANRAFMCCPFPAANRA